ncbi:unnamed protein product [Parnassius apollo]|uniref:(apollo) hypothetical protein n=1 Tax=Parnassius apollo TaxID=110799 RepID=A0A8S3XHW4_PARAO|nr:unnamed protein product [Parnassius apollo]
MSRTTRKKLKDDDIENMLMRLEAGEISEDDAESDEDDLDFYPSRKDLQAVLEDKEVSDEEEVPETEECPDPPLVHEEIYQQASTSRSNVFPQINTRNLIWKKRSLEYKEESIAFLGSTELGPELMKLETPLQFFSQYFSEDLLKKIVEETNKYSTQTNIDRPVLDEIKSRAEQNITIAQNMADLNLLTSTTSHITTICDSPDKQISDNLQERPFLWDKTEDVYEDKNLKLAAWREVCLILKPNFDELDEKERKQYGKQVSTKLNNIRDSWLKTVKKQKDESKSTSSAKKTRNYLYHEQLMFLIKVSEPRPPHESVSKKARTETEVGMESDFRSPLVKDKRKIDNKEVNNRMVKFLDSRINPEKENHHLSFFKGIIPILNTITIEETLEFQASVMTMLQKIKSRNYERPNYGHWRDSYYNQMTGPDQYSGYYTHNSVNQQATPTHINTTLDFLRNNNSPTTSIPSTSSQTSNPIPASPSASSNHSIHSQVSDYLDFEGI